MDEAVEVVKGVIGHQFLQLARKDIHVDEPADVLAFHMFSREYALQDLVLIL